MFFCIVVAFHITIRELINKDIPENELKLITLYFESQIGNISTRRLNRRAAVVCTNGVVVSKVLLSMLTKLFPEINIVLSVSVREFESIQEDFDLVFSTVPLNIEIPIYIVRASMTIQEKVQLRYKVLKDLDENGNNYFVDRIIETVKQNSQIYNQQKLKNELLNIILNEGMEPIKGFDALPDLDTYIDSEDIIFIQEPLDWENAVTLSFSNLIEKGIVGNEYVEDCIKQMREGISYQYFSKKLAIPHSYISDKLTDNKISLLISKFPINFPQENSIYAVAGLALTKSEFHIKALNQLAELAQNETLFTELVFSKNKEQIRQVLRRL